MGYELTVKAKTAAEQTVKTPQLILEIEGIDTIYSAVESFKVPRYGDGYVYGEPNLFYGKTIKDNNVKDFINLKGSTKRITQQLNQDKGGTGSISNMVISLIDKNDFVSREFSQIEILTKKANAYLSFQGLEHPINSIRIFSGVISSFETLAGEIKLTIDNPDTLKRQELFDKLTDEIKFAINSTEQTITIADVTGFVLPQDALTSYIRIEDEVIKINGISGNSFINCDRGQLDTVAVSHDIGTEVESFYRLQGNAIDLSLKLMLSGQLFADTTRTPFGFVSSGTSTVSDAIYFNDSDIEENLGLVLNDFVSITGSTSNDLVDAEIFGFGKTSENTSYIIVNQTLIDEVPLEDTIITFKSQYDVLPIGCSMVTDEVDVNQHIAVRDTFGQAWPDIDIYIKDSVSAKELIEEQLYFPVGGYYLPRKGRASIGYTAPSLGSVLTPTLNETNVFKAGNIKVKRSTTNNFYNAITYRYEEKSIEDKFLAVRITSSEDSNNRLRTGNKPLTIDARGFRNSVATATFIDSISKTFLDRYKFAAESFSVEVSYGIGFSVEVGDTVVMDGTKLNIFDSSTGLRNTFKRIMEVINKSLDITGKCTLQLIDTSFGLKGRYFTFSPSSIIDSTSTTTSIKVKRSFGTTLSETESKKWEVFVGDKIRVHDLNFTFDEHVTLIAIDPNDNTKLITSALSQTPQEDWIVDSPDYSQASDTFKLLHGNFTPQETITSGVSATEFIVDNVASFFVGAVLDIHNVDYSVRSPEVEIVSIIGNNVTVDKNIGFTPDNSYLIDRIGFSADSGAAYIYL